MANLLVPAAITAAPFAIEEAEAVGSRLASSGVGKKIIQSGENAMSKVLPTIKEESQKGMTYMENIGKKVIGREEGAKAPTHEESEPKPVTSKPVASKPTTRENPVKAQASIGKKEKEGALAPSHEETQPKESLKKRAADALILGGLVPGIGFTLAGSLIGQPSSSQNPDITNGDLAKAHIDANGDKKALENYKFKNGKTFKQVRNEYIKANKDTLLEAAKNKKMLYTDSGDMTKLHKQARLHGIKMT